VERGGGGTHQANLGGNALHMRHFPTWSCVELRLAVWVQEMKDLVKKILVLNPAQRLGVLKGGASDVKDHPWFGSFDWKSFAAGTMRAPYVPKVITPHNFKYTNPQAHRRHQHVLRGPSGEGSCRS